MKRKVIIDTDPGIDDALAIMAAIKNPDIEILGLTTVAGNKGLDLTSANAAQVSTYFGSKIPVYKGAANDYQSIKDGDLVREITEEGVHGSNGLGGVQLPLDESVYNDKYAIDFILDQVKENPGEIDIIALGPLTNLALCLDKDVETMKQVRSIHSMGGGAYRGNRSPVAEFNYWFDPLAVDLLYQNLGEIVPIYMVGLDVTHQAIMDANDLAFIKYIGGDLGQIINDMFGDYMQAYWEQNGYIGTVIHDLMVVIGYFHPEIYGDIYHSHLRCVTDSELARGQTIVDLNDQFKQPKNAYVPMKANSDLYKQKTMRMLFGEEVEELYVKRVLNQ